MATEMSQPTLKASVVARESLWANVFSIGLAYLLGMGIAEVWWSRGHPEPPLISKHWPDASLIPQSLALGIAVHRRWPIPVVLLLGLAVPVAWFAWVIAGEIEGLAPWASRTGAADIIIRGLVGDWLTHLAPPALTSTAVALMVRMRKPVVPAANRETP